jgi:hypothetical protein
MIIIIIIISGSAAQRELWPPRITRFLDHTRHATFGRTPLDAWLYLTLPDNTQQTNIHATGGIRNHDPTSSRGAAVDLRLRPRGHWDRHLVPFTHKYSPQHRILKHPEPPFLKWLGLHGKNSKSGPHTDRNKRSSRPDTKKHATACNARSGISTTYTNTQIR